MFLAIFLLFLVAWLVLWLAVHITFGAIHLLLAVAVIALIVHIFRGHRTV
jgi:hypothetical protein